MYLGSASLFIIISIILIIFHDVVVCEDAF